MRWVLAALLMVLAGSASAQAPQQAMKYRRILVREAQFVYGLNAPVPMLAAQLEQESGWRQDVTAWDGGMGLAQMMPSTAAGLSRQFSDLGKPLPYDPVWSIRAQSRYDRWLYSRVAGGSECERWGAGLKSYNAGLGYVLQAQKRSPNPDVWFGVTEYVPTKQTAKNFEYSRLYPRWILIKRQPHYVGWGRMVCDGIK